MNTVKEKRAIDYLKNFQPQTEPYYLCYSGGKDSDVILILAKLAGVNFEAVHNLTTVDEPETVQYVKANPDVRIETPEKTMWQLIAEKGIPPTRRIRYCCQKLKERGGKGRVKVTGTRWAESTNRRNNQGLVTVIGKPATTAKIADEVGANFQSTAKRGGGIKHRQRREQTLCRDVLSYYIDPRQSNSRLDGRRCLGVFTPLWLS